MDGGNGIFTNVMLLLYGKSHNFRVFDCCISFFLLNAVVKPIFLHIALHTAFYFIFHCCAVCLLSIFAGFCDQLHKDNTDTFVRLAVLTMRFVFCFVFFSFFISAFRFILIRWSFCWLFTTVFSSLCHLLLFWAIFMVIKLRFFCWSLCISAAAANFFFIQIVKKV